MLRLFRITDASMVNKRRLVVRLSATISALGVLESNGAQFAARLAAPT